MKLERKKSNRRYQHQKAFLDMSLKENSHHSQPAIRSKYGLNKTLPSYLQDIKNKYEDEDDQRQVRFKPALGRVKSPLKKSPNSRGLAKTNSLSTLNSNEHSSPKKSSHKSLRVSKLNAVNSVRRSKTKSESSDDNSENKPPSISTAHAKNTLHEKSINCLLSDLLDQTSNNLGCLGTKDYPRSVLKKEVLVTSHSNSSSRKPSVDEKSVQAKENIPKNIQKSPSKVKVKPLEIVNVIVPSFRVKNFSMRYRIEGTENLNDDTYNKKHQKLENEEIKMQKWDMKRQREEYEKSLRMFKSESKGKKNQPNKSKTTEANPATSQQASKSQDVVETLNQEFTLDESEMYIIRVVDDISELKQSEIEQPENLEPSKSKQPVKNKILKAVRVLQKPIKKRIELEVKAKPSTSTVGEETRKSKSKRKAPSPVKQGPVKKSRNRRS